MLSEETQSLKQPPIESDCSVQLKLTLSSRLQYYIFSSLTLWDSSFSENLESLKLPRRCTQPRSCSSSERALHNALLTPALFAAVAAAVARLTPFLLLQGLLVDGAGQTDLEVFEHELAPEWNPVAKHVQVHEAEGLAVHEEAVGGDLREAVPEGEVVHPRPDLVPVPKARVYCVES